ncbi:MAG TPA: hypothetical protein VK427_05230 [Kofleriaceae bacterium]|nr:hypothetical protein [Kofleriaceae bacterium]
MQILFLSSIAVIARVPATSRALFVDAIGLPLVALAGTDYFASEHVAGCKHFGVWPLAHAARACFGSERWPSDRPVPQVSIELEVASTEAVAAAAAELEAAGHTLLHDARLEPWGQTVARLQSVDGLIVGISFAPWMHESLVRERDPNVVTGEHEQRDGHREVGHEPDGE